MNERNKLILLFIIFFGICLMPYAFPETGDVSFDPVENSLFMLYFYTSNYLLPMIPAFLLAGAISAFFPRGEIIKHLEKPTPRYKVYLWSIAAGILLAVYYSTIFPLLAGIRKKKADIGPTMSFLYTACALNILSIVFTGIALGLDLFILKVLFSLIFALLIGATLSKVYRDEKSKYRGMFEYFEELTEGRGFGEIDKVKRHDAGDIIALLATLAALLFTAAIGIDVIVKIAAFLILSLVLVLQLRRNFSFDEIDAWLDETYLLFKKIVPLVWLSVATVGVFAAFISDGSLRSIGWADTLIKAVATVLFAVALYFPMLTEIPVGKLLLDLGMNRGVVLAFLLAAPVISPPTMLVLSRIIGKRKTWTYAILVAVTSILAGLLYSMRI